MGETQIQRKLAAILAADVAESSRLMGIDEAATRSRLTALRRERNDPTIARRCGRIVKPMGDGALVEFASALNAVDRAVAIERRLGERPGQAGKAEPIQPRIGVHFGDVIIAGDDSHGDGANIAARLEGVAGPGGTAISDDARRQVHGEVAARVVDDGEHSRKNIAGPVRVDRLDPGARVAAAPPLRRPPGSGQPLT